MFDSNPPSIKEKNMNRITMALSVIALWAAASPSTVAQAHSDANPPSELQGLWIMNLTLPGQPSAPLLVTYTSDGNTLATGSQPGGQTQHGVWVRVGDRQFAGTALFFLYDDKGALAGMIKVQSSMGLAADLNHIQGTAQADILDLAGNVVSSITGITFTQARVAAGPSK